MPDMPNKNDIPKTEEVDEIDRFLDSLPPEDGRKSIFEGESVSRPSKEDIKTPVTSFFALFAWLFFLGAVLVALRALPSGSNMFNHKLDVTHIAEWNLQHLALSTWFLLATIFVCVVGLVICFVKKLSLTRGSALNFLILGGLSVVAAVFFFIVG